MTDTVSELVELVMERDEAAGLRLVDELASVGLKGPQKFGDGPAKSPEVPPDEMHRREVLLKVAVQSLQVAVAMFERADAWIVRRLQRAEAVKTCSAIFTAVLSSATITSLAAAPQWAWVVGVATTVSAVLGVVVSRLEGGEYNIAQRYAGAVTKSEEARLLLARLAAIDRRMLRQLDIDGDVETAKQLVLFLRSIVKEWRVPLGSPLDTPPPSRS